MFQLIKEKLERPKWTSLNEANKTMHNGDEETSNDGLLGQTKWPRRNHGKYILYLLLGLNVAWSLLNLTFLYSQHPFQLNRTLRLASTPSPIFNAVDMGPRTERTIGGLRENGNIFRKAPSRAVDEAWSLVAMDGFEVINATAADLRAAGEDPNVAARWDVGVDAYPVEVEVSHKIHCLDRVRKEIWGKHYFGKISIRADDEALANGEYKDNDDDLYDAKTGLETLKGERRNHRSHTMHCLHMVLQDLMCNADVGIIPIVWTKGPGPRGRLQHVDKFSTQKQCRNFDAVLDWVQKNAVKGANEGYGTLKYIPGTPVSNVEDTYTS